MYSLNTSTYILNVFIYFIYLYGCFINMYVWVPGLCSAFKGQNKRVSDPLELEIQTPVIHRADSGSQIQILLRIGRCS